MVQGLGGRNLLTTSLANRAYFTTVVRRGQDVLSEVKSCWCCLDAVTQRPARLARDVASRFLPPSP